MGKYNHHHHHHVCTVSKGMGHSQRSPPDGHHRLHVTWIWHRELVWFLWKLCLPSLFSLGLVSTSFKVTNLAPSDLSMGLCHSSQGEIWVCSHFHLHQARTICHGVVTQYLTVGPLCQTVPVHGLTCTNCRPILLGTFSCRDSMRQTHPIPEVQDNRRSRQTSQTSPERASS